jgi:hypothetical protein
MVLLYGRAGRLTPNNGAFRPGQSDEPRCTFQFGFNKRAAVQDVTTKGYGFGYGSSNDGAVIYDDAYIRQRSRMIQWAISARAQRYPGEAPFVYKPLAPEAERLLWDSEALREDPNCLRTMDGSMAIVV